MITFSCTCWPFIFLFGKCLFKSFAHFLIKYMGCFSLGHMSFSFHNQQGNANQNHNEISPHTCQDSCFLKESESEVAQSCPTLCDSVDCSPPGSSVYGILQGGILEWVAISFSRRIFTTQGSNLGLLHFRQIFYYLSQLGKSFL